jgi:hypothetical protein
MLNDMKSAGWIAAFLLFSVALWAQPKENDPYTIIGLGNIYTPNFAAVSAMPGLSATYHNRYRSNIVNPASGGWLDYVTFEAGGFYQFKQMVAPDASDNVHLGNLSYLSLGIPLHNQFNKFNQRKDERKPYVLAMNLSLTPYSLTGYDLENIDSTNTDVGRVLSTFEGNGGTYKFLWNNSFRYRNLAVGGGIGYLFGKQSREHWDYFNDYDDEFRNRFIDEVSVGGFIWNAGLLYEYVLPQKKEYDEKGREIRKPKTRISLGAYGHSKYKANTTTDLRYERRQTLGGFVNVDTLRISSNEEGSMTLPAEFGVGIALSKDFKWRIGVDYSTTKWTGYENENSLGELGDETRIALGAEFIPDVTSLNYGPRIRYRLGGFYRVDPRSVSDNGQFSHKAVTFGVGLPLKSPESNKTLVSFVDIGLEVGRYGDPDFVKETYFKLNLGFSLNDNRWFLKRKYN